MSTVTHIWLEAPLFPESLALLSDSMTVATATDDWALDLPAARSAQAIIASSLLRYDAELFGQLPNLRLIARTGIGVDNIDLAAATDAGIVVVNTPDGPTESTAEHTVAMLLALAKRLKQGNANLAADQWGPRQPPLIGQEVIGKTLGLLGLGRIGRRVAAICRLGLGMNVIGFDPYVTPAAVAELGITHLPLDEVLARADFVSLHMPATPETYRIMNATRIAAMKDGAYLLNLSRGPLVDPDALLDALARGKLAGAGLDVFDPEPPPAGDRLRNHPDVVATPHSATLTYECRERMERMAIERVLAFARGERPPDVVNAAVYERTDSP